jgi:hypothetical protein
MTYVSSKHNTQPTPTPATHNVYWIGDDSHGWLAVSLEAYPVAIDYGSGYGYMDNNYVYLEEDLEAVAFLMDHPQLRGASKRGMLAEKQYLGDAPIRKLRRNYDILDTAKFSAKLAAVNSVMA